MLTDWIVNNTVNVRLVFEGCVSLISLPSMTGRVSFTTVGLSRRTWRHDCGLSPTAPRPARRCVLIINYLATQIAPQCHHLYTSKRLTPVGRFWQLFCDSGGKACWTSLWHRLQSVSWRWQSIALWKILMSDGTMTFIRLNSIKAVANIHYVSKNVPLFCQL